MQWLGLSPVFWQSKPADANQLLWTSRTPVTAPPSIEVPPRIEKQSQPGRARVADESVLANAISRRTVWRGAKSWERAKGYREVTFTEVAFFTGLPLIAPAVVV